MICPIHSGSGVSVKLDKAVANGMPVLATPFAARGIPVEANPALVLLDTAKDWVAFLNSDRAEGLARQSPPLHIMKRFRPETHAEAVAGFIQSAMANGPNLLPWGGGTSPPLRPTGEMPDRCGF
jgi:hypothetical protein